LEEGEERALYHMISDSDLRGVGKKTKDGLVVICSNVQKPEKILKTYKKRWNIERCFKNMKTQGLNLENTHMTSLDRLMKLMAVVSVAILLASLLGLNQKCPFKKTVQAPLYSYFTREFRWLKHNLNIPHPYS
jgi:transposase